jgi:chromate transporter
MAIHIGYIFGGLAGLIITGVCFITPAVLITGFLAWIYTTYGTLRMWLRFLQGLNRS